MNAARRPQGNENPEEEPFIPDLSEGAETGLYLALFELIDEGLIITGDEVVLEANSAACRLLERDYRQLAGKPLANLFPSERDFLDARARLFIQGEMRGSLRVSLPGERHRDLRFVAAARIRPGIHALILSPDVIAEAYASTTFDEAPAVDALWPRLAAALEQPVIVIDERDRIAAANAAALGALGLTRGNLIGQAVADCLGIDWPAADAAQIARLKVPGRTGEITARVLAGPKPDWRLLLLPPARHGAAPEDAPAAPGDSVLERMFVDSPLPTLLCEGPQLRILAANAAAARVYGYSRETLCTMEIGALRTTPGDGRHAGEPGIWQHRRCDGTTFDVDIVTYALDAAAHPGLTVVMHDLPEAPLLAFETRLRQAVDLRQLDVHFQPLVDVRDGTVHAGEALLRWHHPELGTIPFQRFAGVARDAGQLVRMGDWVLHAACTAAAAWPQHEGRDVRVVVNVALEQLLQGNLGERVHHALSASGLDAERLELDLDERVLNDEHTRLIDMLQSIAESGVRLAIDDYGRGLSSIPRLKRYPLNALKLDHLLVREVGIREDSEAIVEAIAGMAGILGLEVLARGVETEAQEAFLSALGCRLQQGPLFGQPMTTGAFGAFLA
ncbi:sensor domain-containing phosphodiesterase [Aromatoleum evansii]|uniref:sensor domain-containing phosphodiesterase n=1 Tax=Aromatoleum evansii TaxID=59406 RepID=UPI001FE3778C|nr:EAL domain-containing protein [Aromatoleum evansii]